MTHQHIQLKLFGKKALLLEWPQRIDRAISQEILTIQDYVLQQTDWGILDVVPAYQSLLIEFNPEKIAQEVLEEKLLASITQLPIRKERGQLWEIPVTYNGEDLATICTAKNSSVEELIHLHTAPTYYVYFIGFLPGFLYLGDLPKALHFPRRSAPRARVPKGAVAIGGQQTGIYPQASPGGWQIIGHTDFNWFSVEQDPPSRIHPGDRIKFVAQ